VLGSRLNADYPKKGVLFACRFTRYQPLGAPHVRRRIVVSSWINQVERWFAELTRKRLQRGVHTSVR
jgi:hypothetical protein